MKQQLLDLFETKGGVLTTAEIRDHGISYYFIGKLLEEGLIESVSRGVYRLSGSESDEWLELAKMVSGGIFCLYSAALYHELSTFVSSEYHLAIPKKNKVRLPAYPLVQLYYWEADQYHLGIIEVEREESKIRLYDPEKTVCDFIKFRNKVGVDAMKEVLKNYLSGPKRNINKLGTYSKALNIRTVMEQYLQILL